MSAAATSPKRILFVDDEIHLLAGLENMLRRFRSVWDMCFAESFEAALARLRETAFDVVVSDVHLGSDDGFGLLDLVKQHSPQAVRIILSGTADQDSLLRAAGVAHQFLAKPCRADELKSTIERSLALRELLHSERLGRVAARLRSLPPMPTLYLDIQGALAKGDSIDAVGGIVARDVAMSAKVLQLVNSAFFGLARRLANPVEAVRYLGMDKLTALVLTNQVFEHARRIPPERLDLLWTHSLRAATFARTIAKLEQRDAKEADVAYLAGMLHDVGLLLMMNEMEEELAEAWKYARRFGLSCAEAERRVIGASHATVGAYLMGIWGLPDPVIQPIAAHHDPAGLPQDGFSVATAVHVATALDCGEAGNGLGETERDLDRASLERLGLAGRLPVWSAECARLAMGSG